MIRLISSARRIISTKLSIHQDARAISKVWAPTARRPPIASWRDTLRRVPNFKRGAVERMWRKSQMFATYGRFPPAMRRLGMRIGVFCFLGGQINESLTIENLKLILAR
jgi:hypothetical protein